MATLLAVGIQGLVMVVITVISLLMPSMTRRDLLFGVTVAHNARETAEGKAIIRRYRLGVLLVAVIEAIGLALLWLLAPPHFWNSLWIVIIPLVLVLIPDIPYLLAWRSARALAIALPPASTPAPSAGLRPRRYADYVPLIWEALPLALIALTASYLAFTYAAAPAIIPTHFDAAGNPNAFSTKSIGSYFMLVWTQLFLYALITFLSVLTVRAKATVRVPVFLKLAPDLDEAAMDGIAKVIATTDLDGLIVSNTTITRDPVAGMENASESGGLSGKPLFNLATRRLAQMRQRTSLPIIGVGGIHSPESALAKFEAGANAIQLYTALVFGGLDLLDRIKRGLANTVRAEGKSNISDVVGRRAAEWAKGELSL